jgi:hypothetical protein
MPKTITVKLNLPDDWNNFRMPAALDKRLHSLLDKQDLHGKLSAAERREAEALVELSEMLSLMKIRAGLAPRRNGS